MSLIFDTVVQSSLSFNKQHTFEELPPVQSYKDHFSTLYSIAQKSDYVFASPLGPFYERATHFHLPRFFYFGPDSSDNSLRLAFIGGLDHRDFRSSSALLSIIGELAGSPSLGHSLHLSFFPLLDVLGLMQLAPERNLLEASWKDSKESELKLFARDANRYAYHGFIRLETGDSDDAVTIRLRSKSGRPEIAPDVELISSEEVEPFEVRWATETKPGNEAGPLDIFEGSAHEPFELTLSIPGSWTSERYREAASLILRRFIVRHRGFISYAQDL